MTLGVACAAILPHPMGTHLKLPSDWPSHGYQLWSKATIMAKKSAQINALYVMSNHNTTEWQCYHFRGHVWTQFVVRVCPPPPPKGALLLPHAVTPPEQMKGNSPGPDPLAAGGCLGKVFYHRSGQGDISI